MKFARPLPALLLIAIVLTVGRVIGAPAQVIYDTDMASDVDDVGALAILNAMADRGEANILGCMVSSNNEGSGPCIEIINTWYGRGDIPIGRAEGLAFAYPIDPAPEQIPSAYTQMLGARFPHHLKTTSDAQPATRLYRKLLAKAADHSVTIISVGFLRNLSNLLDSAADEISPASGVELIKQKVVRWVCMGGKFPEGRFADGSGEYNLAWDTRAAIRAIHDWPTPVVFSGWEIGSRIKVGSCLRAAPAENPVRAAYDAFNHLGDRESWDLTAVLFAIRGESGGWQLSAPGQCFMHAGIPHGYNAWLPSKEASQYYLIEKAPTTEVAHTLEELLLRSPQASHAQP